MNTKKNIDYATDLATEATLRGLEVTFDEFYSEMMKDSPKAEPVEINYAKSIYMIAGVVVFFALSRREEKYYSILSDFIKALIRQGQLKNPDFKNNILECMNFIDTAKSDNEDSGKLWLDDFRIALGNWIFKKYYLRDTVSSIDTKHSLWIGGKAVGQVFGFWISQHSNILSAFVNKFEKDYLANLDIQFKKK